MQLFEIGPEGSLPDQIILDDFFRQILDATAALYLQTGFAPPWTSYVVVENDLPIGACAFKTPPAEGRVEIAYCTAPGHEGRGIATSLAARLVQIARRQDRHLTVFAQTLPQENASTSVLKKLGFQLIGTVEHPQDGLVWEWELPPQVLTGTA